MIASDPALQYHTAGQFLNESLPNVFTDWGITIFLSPVQSLNTPSPILVSVSGRLIWVI